MILYIQTAFLGDLLLSIPTLKRLRHLYPNKEIHLLCRKGFGHFFTENGIVDKAFEGYETSKPTWKEVNLFFSEFKYDILICPHESIRSNLIARRVKSTKKIGYSRRFNSLVFDERHKRPMALPEALRQLYLLSSLDQEVGKKFLNLEGQSAPFSNIPEWSEMSLEIYANKLSYRQKLKQNYGVTRDKVVALSPGSVWPTKKWGIAKYKTLASDLYEKGYDVILVGAPNEKGTARKISSELAKVIDLTGETNLSGLAGVLAGCDLLVANDSGSMHMASVVDIACIALFGPTVTRFGYQPWNSRAHVLENKNLNCRPCSAHGTKSCPIGTHECMTSISVETVLRRL